MSDDLPPWPPDVVPRGPCYDDEPEDEDDEDDERNIRIDPRRILSSQQTNRATRSRAPRSTHGLDG
jgi:hypothetical protein